jgi:hypothetical protein
MSRIRGLSKQGTGKCHAQRPKSHRIGRKQSSIEVGTAGAQPVRLAGCDRSDSVASSARAHAEPLWRRLQHRKTVVIRLGPASGNGANFPQNCGRFRARLCVAHFTRTRAERRILHRRGVRWCSASCIVNQQTRWTVTTCRMKSTTMHRSSHVPDGARRATRGGAQRPLPGGRRPMQRQRISGLRGDAGVTPLGWPLELKVSMRELIRCYHCGVRRPAVLCRRSSRDRAGNDHTNAQSTTIAIIWKSSEPISDIALT